MKEEKQMETKKILKGKQKEGRKGMKVTRKKEGKKESDGMKEGSKVEGKKRKKQTEGKQ